MTGINKHFLTCIVAIVVSTGCGGIEEQLAEDTSEILNGSAAGASFPSVVFLQHDLGGGDASDCSATVVRGQCLLTARHCNLAKDDQMYVGGTSDQRGAIVARTTILAAPYANGLYGDENSEINTALYGNRNTAADLAVVYMKPKSDPNDAQYIDRAEYRPMNVGYGLNRVPVRNATVVGFGSGSPLFRTRQVGSVDLARYTSNAWGGVIDAVMNRSNQMIRPGDSGGPLIVGGEIVGVVSRGRVSGPEGRFAATRDNKRWIKDQIREFCAPTLNARATFDGGRSVETVNGPMYPGSITLRNVHASSGPRRSVCNNETGNGECTSTVRGFDDDEVVTLIARRTNLPRKPNGKRNHYVFDRWADATPAADQAEQRCICAEGARATNPICNVELREYLDTYPAAEDALMESKIGMNCAARFKDTDRTNDAMDDDGESDDTDAPPPSDQGGGLSCSAGTSELPVCSTIEQFSAEYYELIAQAAAAARADACQDAGAVHGHAPLCSLSGDEAVTDAPCATYGLTYREPGGSGYQLIQEQCGTAEVYTCQLVLADFLPDAASIYGGSPAQCTPAAESPMPPSGGDRPGT